MRKFSFIFVVFIVSCINCFADEMINGAPQTGAGVTSHNSLTDLDADDHSAIYPGLNQAETISGIWTHSANSIYNDGVYIKLGTDSDVSFGTPLGSVVNMWGNKAYDLTFSLINEGAGTFNMNIPSDGQYQINGVALAASDVGAQTAHAYLSDIAGLTPTATAVLGWNTAGTDIETKSQLLLGSNFVFTLPDAAGAYAITGLNSAGSTIFSVNSLGEMSVPSINEDLLVAVVGDITDLADDTYIGGKLIKGLNAGEEIDQWDLVLLSDTDGEWHKAEGSPGSGNGLARGFATTAGTDGNELVVLVAGIFRNDGYANAYNAENSNIYMAATSGDITYTPLSASGSYHKIVGWSMGNNIICADVDNDYLVVQ